MKKSTISCIFSTAALAGLGRELLDDAEALLLLEELLLLLEALLLLEELLLLLEALLLDELLLLEELGAGK